MAPSRQSAVAAPREGYGDEADPIRTSVAEQPVKETTAVYREFRAALARNRASGAESAGG